MDDSILELRRISLIGEVVVDRIVRRHHGGGSRYIARVERKDTISARQRVPGSSNAASRRRGAILVEVVRFLRIRSELHSIGESRFELFELDRLCRLVG